MEAKQITTPQFWRSLNPAFHVADLDFVKGASIIGVTPDQCRTMMTLLKQEGYLQARLDWGLDLKAMADAVRALSAAELSPVFAFLYDEFWVPFVKLHHLYAGLLGEKYYLLPDFWVWNVDPKKGDSGWTPHRDKGRQSLFPDGSPKSLTTWILLSTATPLNGCMYLVPAMFDTTYNTEDEKSWKFDYSSIRALPGQPGDFFIWNQAVLHWGSKTSPRAPESRVSMAFEFQRADVEPYNKPLIQPLGMLSFEARLKLIAKQILQYKHMYKLDPNIEKLATELIA
jgi:hypothetical protein